MFGDMIMESGRLVKREVRDECFKAKGEWKLGMVRGDACDVLRVHFAATLQSRRGLRRRCARGGSRSRNLDRIAAHGEQIPPKNDFC